MLRLLSYGLGGAISCGVITPAARLVLAPDRTVTAPTEPLDVGAIAEVGPTWRKLQVVAPELRDAWVAARDVVLGAAWVRNRDGKLEALSAICPHLGCAVDWDGAGFVCPCHDSRFGVGGELLSDAGPAKRGLDPLPISVRDGRLRLTWIQYKLDTATREPG